MGNQTILDILLTRERTALDRWGQVRTRWNVTEVYEHLSGDWKIVHSHF